MSAKKRFIKELAELKVKLKKLTDFMESADYDRLSNIQQILLTKQHAVMTEYKRILEILIDTWEESEFESSVIL
jgi:hypothetical protein